MKKNAIRMVVFSLVAVLMLAGAGRLLVPKWTDPINPSTATVRGFYEEPKDSLDVLYLGTCNVYNNVNPLAMWRDYGFTGYVFATPDQEIWTSYYYLEEALKYQKPKVVVLDALMLPDVKHSEEGYARQALDNLRPSATKLKNAYATLEQPDLFSIASVMMPALRFHDRWKDLQRSDFEGVLKAEPSVYKGFAPIFYAAPYEGSLEHMTPLGGGG